MRTTKLGRWALKLALVAGFAISPASKPMGMGGIGDNDPLPPPEFQSAIIDQFGGLKRPTRIAVSEAGEIYVSEPVRGIVAILDSYGRRVGTLSEPNQPLGVAVTQVLPGGCGLWRCAPCAPVTMVYVGDQSDGSVWVFENREQVRKLGTGADEFLKPNGVAATAKKKTVYVVDSETSQVALFDGKGTRILDFGSPGSGNGQLDFPTDIAVNEAAGEVYVSDFGNRRIVVFGLQGAWLRNLDPPSNDQGDPAFYRIAGLGIGPSGNLYVVDSALGSVTILTPDGALVDIVGYQHGTYGTGELKVPVDAAADGSFLYVTSSRDRLVKVFAVGTP